MGDRENLTQQINFAEETRARDLEVDAAKRQHDVENEAWKAAGGQAGTLGQESIRTLTLVAAGAVAATLGFYGANYAHLSTVTGALDTFNQTLVALMKALLFIVATPVFGYFSQVAYQSTVMGRTRHYERPFVRETPTSRRYGFIGDLCRWLAVATGALGVVALGWAGIQFTRLV